MSDEYTLPVNDDIYITGEIEEVAPDFSEIDDDDSTQETVTRTPAVISSDNRSSIGSGELNPSPSDAVPADVSTSEVIVTQRVRHQIDDYEPAALKALSDAGAVFYGVYADGHEEGPVSWTEVHDLDPEGTIIELDEEIASAIAQNFWADTQGVHITDDPYNEWIEAYESNPQFPNLSTTKNYYNILLNAGGALLRRALNNLVSINRTAISFYDGLGNASTNIMAFFGRNGAQIGRSDEKHVVINSSGIGSYNGDGTVADFTMRGSSIVNSTISGSALVDNTITGGKIANATITGAKIDSGTITNANIANGTITGAKIDAGTITNANIQDGTIQGSKIQGSTLTDIPFAAITDAEVEVASIADAQIATATIGEAQVENLTTNYAHLQNGVIDNATIDHADVNGLDTTYATISNLNAATARIGDLEADHVSVDDFEAEQGYIDALQAATADIATIRADSAKVHSLTAAQLSTATAYIAALNADNITAASLSADVGKIHNLTANEISAAAAYIAALNADSVTAQNIIAMNGDFATVKANAAKVANLTAAQLEADHATVGSLDANYAQINMANVNNAWIANGTIKDGAISNGMINSVSANKLTAGTIDASNITVTNLNADNITTGTINGQRIGEGSLSLSKLEEDVYTETEVDSIVSNLQTQIDGAIETWTGTVVPTLSNSPASSWTTNAIKDTHVGDVYFVVNSQSQQNGYNYRFTKSGNNYSWQLIKDSDVTNALQRLTTAEGKIGTIEQFDSDISSWKTDTDEEISSIKSAATTLTGRVSTAEGQIATKVDATTFNTLSQTVGENSSAITQLTTETTTISRKVDSQNPFIIGTQTAQTGSWTGNAPTLASLVDGQQITYWLPYAPSGNASLNLTLKDGSETGAIPCYYSGTSRLTTHYTANNAIHLTYRTNISGITQGWWADANYDSNTPYTKYSDTVVSGKNGLKRYTLCMRDDADNFTSIVNQANNTNVSGKTCYTGGLKLGSVCYHATGGDYAAGANSGVIYESYGGIDFRYSVNGVANAASTELQLGKPVYLVGTIGADGLFYLDTTKWWTQTSFVEGKAYVLVGTAYSSYYAIFVAVDNPTYIYEDDELVEIQTSRITKTTNKVNTVSDTVDEHTRKIGNLETTVETKADGSTVETISNNLNTISDTVSGHTQTISSITSTQTTMQGKLDKTLVETTQLWFSKANTTTPNKPTTQVTSTATTGNAWTTVVPAYNASYPNYYYCYQWKYSDGTYGWSSVTRDIATGEMQATARQAQNDIDNLEIGGRNLLLWSGDANHSPVSRWGSQNNVTSKSYDATYDAFKYVTPADSGNQNNGMSISTQNVGWWVNEYGSSQIANEKTYTFSIDVMGTLSSGNPMTMKAFYSTSAGDWVGAPNPAVDITDKVKSDSFTRVSVTFTLPSIRIEGTRIVLSLGAKGATFYVKNPKLELGNRATDWSPAPEDVDADILTAQTSADNAQSTADKNVKSSIQLWFTKANGSAPSKPTTKVTLTSTGGNAWTTVVPTYSSGYPHYFYCWQYELADGTCTWSDVIYDRATTENQSNSRSAVSGVSTLTTKTNNIQDTVDGHTSQLSSITSTQTTIQGSAVKSTVQLWFTKANTTAPAKPTAHVTTNNAATGNVWNLAVPTYNASYPNYYYCYEYQYLNDTYGWSAVTRDIATGEMQATSRQAQSDIDNLEIGGRNLLLDTANEKSQAYTSAALMSWHFAFDGSLPQATYTLSFDMKSSNGTDKFYTSVADIQAQTTKQLVAASVVPSTSYTRYFVTFNYTQTADSNGVFVTSYPGHGGGTNNGNSGTVYIKNIKLEKGNKATDWTPAPEDVDDDISTAQTSADNAQATADKNVKESQQLWFTKANGSAPNKPTSKVTSTSTSGNAWTTKVPTYSSSYPYYFYCMQYIAADGTVTWSDVVYDQATTEAQSVARTTSANLSTLQSDYATFKQTTQNFESTVGSTYATKTELSTTNGNVTALQNRNNTLDAQYGYPYKKDIIIYGESNKYYPVYFTNTGSTRYDQYVTHDVMIKRGYAEQAPSDWYSSTHKGSLNLHFGWNYGGWGGATYKCDIYEFSEMYSTLLGDILVGADWGVFSIVYLRGGGTTGAIYHIYSDVPFIRHQYMANAGVVGENDVPYIGLEQNLVYAKSGDTYQLKVRAPLTTPNVAHLTSLKTNTSMRFTLVRSNWNETSWASCSTIGHTDNWKPNSPTESSSTYAIPDCRTLNAGDTFTATGVSTDKSITHSIVCEVTAVPTAEHGDIPAKTIAVNDNSTYVKSVESRVSTAETSIQQNRDSIALKANASDVYTKTQTDGLISIEVSNRNSAIQQSTDAISLSVSQTYTTKTEFNALEVGGRNLFAMAGSIAGYLHTNGIDISGQSASKERTTDYISVDASTKYVFQAWYDQSNPTSSYMWICLSWYTSDKTHISQPLREHMTEDNYKSWVVTSPTNAAYARLSARWVEPGWVYGKVKFERGTKPTDWSPAPEDVASDATSKANAAEASAKAYTDSVEIGGRNYYRAQRQVNGSNIYVNAGTVTISDYTIILTASGSDLFYANYTNTAGIDWTPYFGYLIPVTPGESLTLTTLCDEVEFNKNYIGYWDSNKKTLSSGVGIYSTTKTVLVPNGASYANVRVGYGAAVSGTTYHLKVKLEKGTKATDWTPAPEDVDAAIEASPKYKYVTSAYKAGSQTYNRWLQWGQEGYSITNFALVDAAERRKLNIGDLACCEGWNATDNKPIYIIIEVTEFPSTTHYINGISHGLIDSEIRSTVNAIESRVSTAETSITQTNNQIALKANASDVYTKTQTDGLISTEASNRNSAIEQSANSINLSVSQTYTTKTEFNNRDFDFDNLILNSRKMALGTSNYNTGQWRLAGNADMTKSRVEIEDGPFGSCGAFQLVGTQSVTSDTSCFGMDTVPFIKGERYRISMYARVVSGTGYAGIEQVLTGSSYARSYVDSNKTYSWASYQCIELTTSWKKIWVEFEATATTGNLYIGGAGTNATIQMCMVSLQVASTSHSEFESAKSEIQQTTDGITSTVSKISSVKYYTGGSSTLANIKVWAAEGYTSAWNFTGDLSNLRIGDTVYLKYGDTTRGCNVYIKGTVNSISGQSVNFTSHGYEDVLPVDTIKSTINQSADSVKIEARHVNIEGAAIFSSGGRLSDANIKKTANTIPDTRNDNQPPSWYFTNYPKQTVTEFKLASTMGLSGDYYCYVTTVTGWADSSGGYPKQTAQIGNESYWRVGTSQSEWGAWQESETVSGAEDRIQTAYSKIQSRGEQLVVNGNGFMGDNTNFSSLTFDGSVANGSPGSFTDARGISFQPSSDEMFPVDPSKNYRVEFDVTSSGSGASPQMYGMLYMYDVDKKLMNVQQCSYIVGSTTTLARELKNGDTTVYLTDASGFIDTSAAHQRSLIFWDYTNSFGYTYPPETYSRNFVAPSGGLWSDYSKINKTNNTITLTSAWTGGTHLAGTSVSQNSSGATYAYFWSTSNVQAGVWTHVSSVYDGYQPAGISNAFYKFYRGTAYCKIAWLWNYQGSSSNPQRQLWVTNISVREDVATSAELNTVKGNAVKRTQRIYYRKSSVGAPSTPGVTSSNWVTQTGDVFGQWTAKVPRLTANANGTGTKYLYLYTCEQREMGDGTLSYTTVLLDDSNTIIDGGTIITGSISANKLDVYDATIGKISTSAINLTGYAQTDDIPTKVSDLTNDTGFVTNDDIQIGGRNLLRNSKAEHSQSSSTSTWFEWPITEAPLDTSQDYTFSFDAKTSNGTDVFYVGFANGSAATQENMATGVKPTATYARMSVTAQTTKTNIRSIIVSSTTSYGRGNGSNTGGTLYIKNVKLERGNKATDWSPAPEDIDADISSKADPSDIPTKVSDLTNDSGFQDSSQVETAITSKGYATQNSLNSEINQRKAQYGTCSTAAATQAKAVTCSNFELAAGKELTVKFSTANTYASGAVQLNVNSKGAKNVWVANAVTSSSNQLLWGANAYITFRYDGAQFIAIGEPRTWYGASTTAESTAAKTDTTAVTGCVICKGAKVELAMTNANTATAPTLNIQSTGAKNIYFGNGTARPTKADGTSWLATNTCTFTFDGQYWRTAGKTYIDANSIVTGYLSADRIEAGSLSANKISATSGTFDTANIPTLSSDKITVGGSTLTSDLSAKDSAIADAAKHTQVIISATNVNYVANTCTLTARFYIDGVLQTSTSLKWQWYRDGTTQGSQTTGATGSLAVTSSLGLAHRYACKCTF